MNSPAIHRQIMSEAPNSTVAPPLDRGFYHLISRLYLIMSP